MKQTSTPPVQLDPFAILIVHLNEDGSIHIQGSGEEIEPFFAECARLGLNIQLDFLSWCG